MSGPEDLDWDEILNRQTPVWEAAGDTYPLREGFGSWGWNWVAERKVWQMQGEADDPCLIWAQRQRGITVRQVVTEHGEGYP